MHPDVHLVIQLQSLDQKITTLDKEVAALPKHIAVIEKALESHLRKQKGISEPYTAADAVAAMVKFRDRVEPVPAWVPDYAKGMAAFRF